MAAKRGARTKKEQFELLVNFAEKNPEIVYQDRAHPLKENLFKKKWDELVQLLNSSALGPTKTLEQWHKTFSELKNNTKKKSRQIRDELLITGGGEAKAKPLLPYEERLLAILKRASVHGAELVEAGAIENEAKNNENDDILDIEQEVQQTEALLNNSSLVTNDLENTTLEVESVQKVTTPTLKKSKSKIVKKCQKLEKKSRVTKLQKIMNQYSELLNQQVNIQDTLNQNCLTLAAGLNSLISASINNLVECINKKTI